MIFFEKAAKPLAALMLFVLFSSLAAQAGRVQYLPESEGAFRAGLKHYVAKDYEAAFISFETLSSSGALHHRMTAALLMAGKSLYKLGRYGDAIPYFRKLYSRFPQSDYVDDAFYGKAASHFRLDQGQEAVAELLRVVESSTDRKLITNSRKLANHIMNADLSAAELRQLIEGARNENSAGLVTVALARKEIAAGATQSAKENLNRYRVKYPNSAFDNHIAQLLKDADVARNRPVKVGVVLPLSGYFSEQGQGVLDGIRFAQGRTRSEPGKMLELVVRDSEGSMVKAIRSTRDLIQRERVDVIVGELESQITAAIGALASDSGVPLMAPAATENGVASVGSTVYQLNSDLELKGRVLAEYAINGLGLRSFATLAPSDEYGQQMIASFSATVDELGGRIIAQTWYAGTPEDLSRQFKVVREAAFHRDSTDVEALIEEAEEKGQKLEARDIPVLSIDAFFMPVYAEDIKYVAPQLALHNIRTQILGGEYLDDIEVLTGQQIQRYINGAIFVSDFFADLDASNFHEFRTNFRLQMKRTPERWEVFGYDAFQLIQHAVGSGAQSAEQINEALQSIYRFEGMKGKISFRGGERVNKDVNLLQFINGRIVKHEIYDSE